MIHAEHVHSPLANRNPLARLAGPLLKWTAVGHTLFGLVWFADAWAAVWPDSGAVIPIVPHRFPAESVVFFFLAGPIVFIAGELATFAYERTGEIPRRVGWWMLVTFSALILIAPLSGAILGIAQSLLWLRAGTPTRGGAR